MSRIYLLLAVVLTLCASPSSIFAKEGSSFDVAVRQAIMLGCLPNAMDIHPFTPDRQEELKVSNIRLTKDVPSDNTKAMIPEGAITAVSMLEPERIIFASVPKNHLCSIALRNVDPKEARKIVIDEITMPGAPWKLTQTKNEGKVQYDAYHWDMPDRPTNMMLLVSGPVESFQDNKGMQLLITIAQVKK